MNYLRILSLATVSGLCGYYYESCGVKKRPLPYKIRQKYEYINNIKFSETIMNKSLVDKWKISFFNVKAYYGDCSPDFLKLPESDSSSSTESNGKNHHNDDKNYYGDDENNFNGDDDNDRSDDIKYLHEHLFARRGDVNESHYFADDEASFTYANDDDNSDENNHHFDDDDHFGDLREDEQQIINHFLQANEMIHEENARNQTAKEEEDFVEEDNEVEHSNRFGKVSDDTIHVVDEEPESSSGGEWVGMLSPETCDGSSAKSDDECTEHKERATVPGQRKTEIKRLASPSMPGEFLIDYGDFALWYHRLSRVPLRILESVTRNTVKEIQHRHWELINIQSDIPADFEAFVDPECNHNFDVVKVGNNNLFPDGPIEERPNCCFCQNNTIWHTFYKYIEFLTCHYDHVLIWTCVLYEPEINEFGELHQNYAKALERGVRTPTHYIKCICCDNNDGTIRLECYKIPNERILDPYPELLSYNKRRHLLEKESGYKILDPISDEQIREWFRDPRFNPHEVRDN